MKRPSFRPRNSKTKNKTPQPKSDQDVKQMTQKQKPNSRTSFRKMRDYVTTELRGKITANQISIVLSILATVIGSGWYLSRKSKPNTTRARSNAISD